ncbi:DsbA family protein [Microvirga sp. VF16]|uniref:DsbA family protein n=1 Tax=Microvirga sp. VF16 TaxID=2807101 RepID=UPI00193D1C51|nr:DsbA family protein [Microvirga sp. VF16]QRM34658.1 DsbA family protein [Microvirga sp. VF16]
MDQTRGKQPRISLRFALAIVLALGSTVANSQPVQFDAPQRQAIEAIIREYLLKNPEVLQEAIGELERRQQEAQKNAQTTALRAEREKLINSPNDYVVGNPSGDVTLVEFFDYNCPYCRKAKGDVDALIRSDPKLRVVLKEFPILGPDSVEASRVVVAAKQQLSPDKYLAFHDKLMETRGRANGERALAVAKEFGLDLARLQKDMQSAAVTAVLQENTGLGDKLGITGTPAFILNEDIIAGAVGLEPLRQAIANTRQCGKIAC